MSLRDVMQAMRYIRAHMFTAVPPTGFHSTRTADLLNYRVSVPPIVTVGHLNAMLSAPSRVEREVAELLGKGVVRRVRVERRAALGEALIDSRALEDMVSRAQLAEDTKQRFVAFLRGDCRAQTVPRGTLSDGQADELVRAGFLTSSTQAVPGSTLRTRPEDRTTLTSIRHIAQSGSGTVSAVGGPNAIHQAGGGGGAPSLTLTSADDRGLRLAVPGHGRYLKLAEGVVSWIRDGLGRTKWGEAPEDWLRERFEGGGLYGTRWKEFWGVEWEWALGQAVGSGVVEIFDTGSVGKGVRAVM